jgi:ABC-type Fe3+ transport system permease subunit
MAAVPWVALVVGLSLTQVDPAQEEAALLVLRPRAVLWRITLPHVMPFIVAAGILTVVGTTTEMTVTNIYLINPGEWTYTEQFYMTFSLQADSSEATVMVLPGLACIAVLVVAAVWLVVAAAAGGQRSFAANKPITFAAGRMRPALAALMWMLVAVLLAIPIASLISKAGFVVVHEAGSRIQSWSLLQCAREVATAPRRFAFEFAWTLVTAVGAATVALLAAVGLAWSAGRGGWRAAVTTIVVVLSLAVPGPLVGAALVWIFNRSIWPGAFDPLVYFYDETPVVVILAQAVHALPLATLVCWYSFRTLDRDVLAAAALDGASPWQVLWRITLPQRWPALAGAWLAGLAIAAGDLAWAQLVRPAGMDLIQRRVFGLVHSGVEEQVAAISIVNVIAYAVLATLILWLVRRPQRELPSSSAAPRPIIQA